MKSRKAQLEDYELHQRQVKASEFMADRNELGMSVDQVAVSLGVEAEEVARWERAAVDIPESARAWMEERICRRLSANRFRHLRSKLGLTKRAISGHLGVDENTVWRWEHERTDISFQAEWWVRYADVHGIDEANAEMARIRCTRSPWTDDTVS